jgi:hypothetical protein
MHAPNRLFSMVSLAVLVAAAGCTGGSDPPGKPPAAGSGGSDPGSGGTSGGFGGSGLGGSGGTPGGGTGGSGGATGGSGGGPATGGTGGGAGGATGGSGGATGGSGGATGGSGGRDGGGAAGAGGAGGAADAGGPASDAMGGPPPMQPPGGPTPSPPPGNPAVDNCMSPPLTKSPLTEGFRQIPCTFTVQSPHTVPQSARYTYDRATNTHTCWVNSNDSSFQPGNGTDPRCELRHREEYRTGQHMLEAEVWIEPRTHRTCIMQSFSTSPPTSFMLTAWNDQTLRYYFGTGNGPVIMTNAFGKWFNLKVLHNTASGKVTVYIDDKESMSFDDRGSSWHWKNGVYGSRTRSETRWRNLRHWVKD